MRQLATRTSRDEAGEYGRSGAGEASTAAGMAVLPGVAPGGAGLGDRLVDFGRAARRRASGRVGGVRLVGGRRGSRHVSRRSVGAHRRDVHPVDGPPPAPSTGERQPREPHGRPSLRTADDCVRGAAGTRPPRACRPCRRSGHGSRFRSRHDGTATVDLDGLRRQRFDATGDRRCREHAVVRLCLVGAIRPALRVGVNSLAAARKRRLEGPQHRRGAQRPTPRRLRLPPGRRCCAGQGAPPFRPGRLGDRSLRHHSHPAVRPAVPGHSSPGEVRRRLSCDRDRRQCVRVLDDRPGFDRR